MAHEVETMVYVGKEPWHGLGVKIPHQRNRSARCRREYYAFAILLEGGEATMSETYFDKEDTAFVYDRETGNMFRLDGDKRVPVTDGTTMANVLTRSCEISAEYAARLASIPFFEDAGS